jgi:hypothetical protein
MIIIYFNRSFITEKSSEYALWYWNKFIAIQHSTAEFGCYQRPNWLKLGNNKNKDKSRSKYIRGNHANGYKVMDMLENT